MIAWQNLLHLLDSDICASVSFFNSPLVALDLQLNSIGGDLEQAIRAAWKAKESDLKL